MGFRVVVVSGLSGSGKTTAMDAIEDLGFFCVDNLPPQLLAPLIELCDRAGAGLPGVAVVMDSRGGRFLSEVGAAVRAVRESGRHPEVLFLLASNEALHRRFSETRRRHPLLGDDGDMAAIERERELLEPLRGQADRTIDTTHMNVHDLRRAVRDLFEPGDGGLPVRIQSFGFKYGAPRDCNLLMDVRFLPNPYFDDRLRSRDGRDGEVAAYALASGPAAEFLHRWGDLVQFLLPHYEKEGRPVLNVAVGCTGGQHRSVAVVEWLASRLRAAGRRVLVEHRDAGRDG